MTQPHRWASLLNESKIICIVLTIKTNHFLNAYQNTSLMQVSFIAFRGIQITILSSSCPAL